MTIHIDITEAQKRFLEIIQAAERGEEVYITKDTQPVVHILAAKEPKKRPLFGSAKGQVSMADDFDAPLDDFQEYIK